MALCLLIGNILMVAIAASNPLYSNAVLQKTLTKGLGDAIAVDGVNPTAFSLMSNISKTAVSEESIARLHQAREDVLNLPNAMHMPLLVLSEDHYISSVKTLSQMGRRTDSQNFNIGMRPEIEGNMELMSGRMYSNKLVDGNTIEVIISERMMKQYDLLVGDVLDTTALYTDASKENTYKIHVVGIFRAADGTELYWSRSPQLLCSYLVMDESLFDELFIANETYPYGIASWWYSCLDYTQLKRSDVSDVIAALDHYSRSYEATFRQNLLPYVSGYESNATELNATLLILQAPILVLVCAFIFMVSKQLTELEENEIAVIKSRGAYKKQILWLYLLQGLLLCGGGLVLGLPLGFFVCMMLGASNSFLEFVQRAALPISFTVETLLFSLGASLIACATMVVPAILHANVSIVSHKVSKQRKGSMPWWQKCFVDVLLIAASLYTIQSHNALNTQGASTEVQQMDPLLYFSSSLFIIGVGLLGIRLIPYIVKLIFFLFRGMWSPALYTSFQRVIRTQNSQTFIMLFLVLTIALGIFNADTARSINTNNEERVNYLTGCDVRLYTSGKLGTIINSEDLLEDIQQLEGVQSATRVYQTQGRTKLKGEFEDVINKPVIMSIHSKEFGQTAWFKNSLLDTHWYNYLNALAMAPDAVIVSSSYRDVFAYAIGDPIQYVVDGETVSGTIYGFVDYWPTFEPNALKNIQDTGIAKFEKNFLIVSNLNYLQSVVDSALNCQIWVDYEDSTASIYEYAAEKVIYFDIFQDANATCIELKNDPVLLGTNGMLTTNFIVILLLCTAGFLIYWILSIQSRTLQFGIFRAMGMSMREIITMLISEQVLISGTAVGIGFTAGILTSKIFVPLIQEAYMPTQQHIPMEAVSLMSDMVRLIVVIGLMILVCLGIIAWIVSKIRISQALKLGED